MGTRMRYDIALRMEQNYVCSVCWGRLEASHVDEVTSDLHCVNPDCAGTGFVTKRYAEKRIEESAIEYMEVRQKYGEQFGLSKPISAAQAMKDLGF
ncbi:MAG: hypothetical protein ABFD24_06035 [Anaerolineaceae bacterium]